MTTATRQIEEWLVSDNMGEFVAYYNPTNHIMHFTRNRDEAWKTTSSEDAFEVARIARTLYRRSGMQMGMA